MGQEYITLTDLNWCKLQPSGCLFTGWEGLATIERIIEHESDTTPDNVIAMNLITITPPKLIWDMHVVTTGQAWAFGGNETAMNVDIRGSSKEQAGFFINSEALFGYSTRGWGRRARAGAPIAPRAPLGSRRPAFEWPACSSG